MLTNYSTLGVSGTALIDATGATGTSTNFLNCRLDLHDNVTIRSPSKPLIIGGAITGPGRFADRIRADHAKQRGKL